MSIISAYARSAKREAPYYVRATKGLKIEPSTNKHESRDQYSPFSHCSFARIACRLFFYCCESKDKHDGVSKLCCDWQRTGEDCICYLSVTHEFHETITIMLFLIISLSFRFRSWITWRTYHYSFPSTKTSATTLLTCHAISTSARVPRDNVSRLKQR